MSKEKNVVGCWKKTMVMAKTVTRVGFFYKSDDQVRATRDGDGKIGYGDDGG